MFVAIGIVPLVAILPWFFAIRPYCRHSGKGFTPGANIGVTYWVDWQEATEVSKAKGDGRMSMICRLVFWFHILGLAILAYAVFNPRP